MNNMAATGNDDLYKIRVVEERGDKVKVHYVGYGRKYDEWKNRDELVVLDDESAAESSEESDDEEAYVPLSLHKILADRIKLSLSSNQRLAPSVRIEIPFNRVSFEGALAKCGTRKGSGRRVRYTIRDYKALDRILGKGWHWRGLNQAGDFCYVILDSIEYYLLKKRALQEYFPPSDGVGTGQITAKKRTLGYSLIFKFIRGDGTPEQFGSDRTIF